MLQRGGEVRAAVVPDRKRGTLHSHVVEHVALEAAVYTDALESYSGLSRDFEHATVDHAERYVDGQVHTNGIENLWSLLKRGPHGTYISVHRSTCSGIWTSGCCTYNLGDLNAYGRFEAVLCAVTGRRLTYAEVTGR